MLTFSKSLINELRSRDQSMFSKGTDKMSHIYWFQGFEVNLQGYKMIINLRNQSVHGNFECLMKARNVNKSVKKCTTPKKKDTLRTF